MGRTVYTSLRETDVNILHVPLVRPLNGFDLGCSYFSCKIYGQIPGLLERVFASLVANVVDLRICWQTLRKYNTSISNVHKRRSSSDI